MIEVMKNLDVTYTVSRGNVPTSISFQDYDEDPTHHGERNYLDAIELATIWMKEGHKFVSVWDSACETISVNDKEVKISHTSKENPHWDEHNKIQRSLQKIWNELHGVAF